MTSRLRLCHFVLVPSIALAGTLAAQPRLVPVAHRPAGSMAAARPLPSYALSRDSSMTVLRIATPAPGTSPSLAPDEQRRIPRWVRWGLVGAATGAVALPLLGSMASDSEAHPARDAFAGAAIGFVVIGGAVALWDALCAPGTSSRRAGLCGRD